MFTGVPQFAARQRPATHAALSWQHSHEHPGCAPLWCPFVWELFSPVGVAAAERIAL